MKIGIDCRLINKRQNTGISRYTEFLIDYYGNRFGFNNIILITNDLIFEVGDYKIIYTKLKPFNIFDFFRFSSFIENLKLDLYHVPFYSAFFRKSSTTKVVVTVHDLMYRIVNGFFGKNEVLNYLKIKYFDFIVKKTLINADRIISVSATTKRDVFNIFNCDSVHIPEDSDVFGDNDFSILDKYNLQNKNFYFYCGNNRPHKNLNFIIDFFNENLQLPPLVLAGKGHRDSVNVISAGIVTDQELKALYKSSIAFVFPSTYEGFGLPILESIRSDTFVIASKIDAFLEFRTDNIFFFELGSKEEFLLAIHKTLSKEFIMDRYFLDSYDKRKIYELNDVLLKNLL